MEDYTLHEKGTTYDWFSSIFDQWFNSVGNQNSESLKISFWETKNHLTM